MARKSELIARQSSRPRGLLGEIVAFLMAFDTARTNRVALEYLAAEPTDAILEIGCGHGRTLARVAARASEGFVAGHDPSEVMLRHARLRNRRSIRQGRVSLTQGESCRIPYPDGRFDKAFAVHVLYFWSDPGLDLREIHRVLRPGGLFLLGFRPRDDPHFRSRVPDSVYTLYTGVEVEELLRQAGFAEVRVEIRTEPKKEMAWAIARV